MDLIVVNGDNLYDLPGLNFFPKMNFPTDPHESRRMCTQLGPDEEIN